MRDNYIPWKAEAEIFEKLTKRDCLKSMRAKSKWCQKRQGMYKRCFRDKR